MKQLLADFHGDSSGIHGIERKFAEDCLRPRSDVIRAAASNSPSLQRGHTASLATDVA